MDLLQIALIFLILLLGVFLSVLGIQVFFILKDLRKSLDKLDTILTDVEKPAHTAAQISDAVATGVKIAKKFAASKQARRLFKRK